MCGGIRPSLHLAQYLHWLKKLQVTHVYYMYMNMHVCWRVCLWDVTMCIVVQVCCVVSVLEMNVHAVVSSR